MSRIASIGIALSLLTVALLTAASPGQAQLTGTETGTASAGALPLAKVQNWSILSLEEGLLFIRTSGSSSGPYFVFAQAAGESQSLFLVYHGSTDAAEAFGALHEQLNLAKSDFYALKELALGATLEATGQWDPLTFGEGYAIAGDPEMGSLGTELYDALVLLEAKNLATGVVGLNSASQSQVTVPTNICNVRKSTASQVPTGPVVINVAAPTSSGTFPSILGPTAATQAAFSAAARHCPGYGTPPAFPVLPGYPTVTVPWEDQNCFPIESTTTSGCMQASTGRYCTQCTCTASAGGGVWKPSGNCTAITSTPVGTACAPVGGTGPCTSGTTACTCTCNAATPPATGGVWGNANCGSPTFALIFAFAAAVLAWHRHRAQ